MHVGFNIWDDESKPFRVFPRCRFGGVFWVISGVWGLQELKQTKQNCKGLQNCHNEIFWTKNRPLPKSEGQRMENERMYSTTIIPKIQKATIKLNRDCVWACFLDTWVSGLVGLKAAAQDILLPIKSYETQVWTKLILKYKRKMLSTDYWIYLSSEPPPSCGLLFTISPIYLCIFLQRNTSLLDTHQFSFLGCFYFSVRLQDVTNPFQL